MQKTLIDLRHLTASVFGLALLASASLITPAIAQDTATADSGSARITLAGKLRLEAQRVATLACEAAVSATPEDMKRLQQSEADFTTMLTALQDGDLALGIRGAESNSRILRELSAVTEAWQPISDGTKALALGMPAADILSRIVALNPGLLDGTEKLIATVSGTYTNENLPFGAIMAINVAIRQDVLLEQMSLSACLTRSGLPGYGDRHTQLGESMSLFETTMAALQNGASEYGLMAPPSEPVKQALGQAADTWTTLKPVLASASSDPSKTVDALHKDLKNVQVLYLLATSKQPDFYRVPLEKYARETLSRWLLEPQLVISLREQNQAHASLAQGDIDAMDKTWRSEKDSGQHDMIAEMMERPLSKILGFYQAGTAGIVTEVFVMDDKGLNVGQSEITSDLWQGDEDKWQQTFGKPADQYHISEVEFDDSTGFYQSQVSLPAVDPVTGAPLGAITFGVSIQSLL